MKLAGVSANNHTVPTGNAQERDLRVLHLVNSMEQCDGVAAHVRSISREMAKQGHEIHVVAGKGDQPPHSNRYPSYQLNRYLHHESRSLIGFLFGIITTWRILISVKPDIIHVHHFYCGSIARIAFAWRKHRIVQTVHAPLALIGRLPHVVGSTIIYVCEATRLHDKTIMPCMKQRMIVIQNGIDLVDGLVRLSRSGSRDVSIREDDIVIGYVGRFVREKGIFDLLRALEGIRNKQNVILAVAGSGECRSEFEKLLQEVGIRTLDHGLVEDVFPFLQTCDIIVVPSRSDEGMPTVIMEAGLARRAVVATDIDGIPEIITHDSSGLLVPPGDVPGLTRAIDKLIYDRELRMNLGKSLYDVVIRDHDIQRTTRDLLDLYAGVL